MHAVQSGCPYRYTNKGLVSGLYNIKENQYRIGRLSVGISFRMLSTMRVRTRQL